MFPNYYPADCTYEGFSRIFHVFSMYFLQAMYFLTRACKLEFSMFFKELFSRSEIKLFVCFRNDFNDNGDIMHSMTRYR